MIAAPRKKTSLCMGLLLLLGSGSAAAQLPGGLGNSGLGNGGLGSGGLDMLGDSVRQLERSVEKAAQGAAESGESTAAAVAKPLQEAASLPAELPILTATGATALVEVVAEDGWRAVQQEWLLMVDEQELQLLQQLDLGVQEQLRYEDLGLLLVRIRVPQQLDSLAALSQLLPQDLLQRLDRNHVYAPQQFGPAPAPATMPAPAPATMPAPAPAPIPAAEQASRPASAGVAAVCVEPVRIGMVDTEIDTRHPAFAAATIVQRDFGLPEVRRPLAHGTAVAGRMLGAGADSPALLPGAQLWSASVFYARDDYSQGATMRSIVAGLNWLLGQQVQVINMSLAGPPNKILEMTLQRLQQRGVAVVAAVGNEGPASGPLYPAAYDSSIGVTAVDEQGQIYRWANRGPQVEFAAAGVSVITARTAGGFGRESGTSMAAPVVSAFAACTLRHGPLSLPQLRQQLALRALDLGDMGVDEVFGVGLLQP